MTESAADRQEADLDDVGAETPADGAPSTDGGEGTEPTADATDGASSSGDDVAGDGAAAAGSAADDGESSSDDGSASDDGNASDGEDGALREEFDALNDRHLRLVAEFNNYRRRNEQERLTAWSRAQADLVEGFLDVLDDLHRVADLDLSNATVEAIMEGIDLVEKKFVRALTDASVEMVDPTGQPFDPEVMEAMMRVPSEDEEQIDTVAQCFQKGYSLKGILVRPARVSVYTQG